MRVLDRKLLRDLRRIWAQSLAIALVLACGIMVLVLANGTLRSLTEIRDGYYERHRFADVFAGATRAPQSLLPEIARIDGVALAEGRIVLSAILDLDGMTEPATARILSLPDGREPLLNVPLLRAGRMPDPLRADEVAVGEPFAIANGLQPGDRFRVTLNGQQRDLIITGHVISPEFIYTVGPGSIMPDNKHFALIWMNENAAAAAGDLDGAFNDLTLTLTRSADQSDVIAAIDRLLAPYGGAGAYGRDRQMSHTFLKSEMDQLAAMAVILPPIFLIVSAFLVNMVLGRLIALERTQIGLLKAVGYTSGAIAGHYLKLSLGIGVIGVLLGWVAGHWRGQQSTALYSRFFQFPWLIYDPGAGLMVVSGLLGMVTVILGALRAVWASVRLAPAVAMLPPAPPQFRRGWVDALGRRAGLRQTTMMILRSVTRWPGRAAVTLFGVSASVAVLVASFFSFDAMDLMMNELFEVANRQHVTLFLTGPRGDIAVTEALELPGVRQAEGAFALPVRLTHGTRSRLVNLQARSATSAMTRLLDDQGQVVALPASGLVIPEGLAETLALAPGDRVQVELLAPPREIWDVTVSGIIRQTLGQEVHMARDAVFALMRQSPQVNQLHLVVDTNRMAALHTQVKATPAVAGLTVWQDVRAEFEATVNTNMSTMAVIYSVLGMLITIGVVYNSARIQLAERAHELASLRVLGFTRAEVSYVLVGELMLLSALAIPLGWIAGYSFAAMVVAGFSTDLVSIPLGISKRTYAVAGLMVFGTALVTSLIVRRGLDRVDLVAALKQKE